MPTLDPNSPVRRPDRDPGVFSVDNFLTDAEEALILAEVSEEIAADRASRRASLTADFDSDAD